MSLGVNFLYLLSFLISGSIQYLYRGSSNSNNPLSISFNEVKATIEKNGKIVESKTYKDVEKLALYVEDILGINKGSISNFTSMHPRLFKSNDLTVAIVPINKAERKVVIKKNNTVNGA